MLAFGQSPAVQTWNPENIVWQRTDSDGTKWAVLEGDKDVPRKPFTYAFFPPRWSLGAPLSQSGCPGCGSFRGTQSRCRTGTKQGGSKDVSGWQLFVCACKRS